jgi:transcriptional regulator with XRE-family HTH domain
MLIGERIRAIREAKNLSQGDIEKRSGLLRHYISRIENGHTVPAVETLEKLARALGVPMYQLFYEGKGEPDLPRLSKRLPADGIIWGKSKRERRFWKKLRGFLARMTQPDRQLILRMAQKMARRYSRRGRWCHSETARASCFPSQRRSNV